MSPRQARFAELYVAGPDDLRGRQARCYRVAYPACSNDNSAGASASTLLRRPNVRAYRAELREAAGAECTARLRNWMELAPDAQDTLRAATAGELVFDNADPKLRPELIRSAVKSAIEILDRALGTTKQMHEHRVQGGIVVAIAGPPQVAPADNGKQAELVNGNGSKGYLPPA